MNYLKIKLADYQSLATKDPDTYYWIQETNKIYRGSNPVVPSIEWGTYSPTPELFDWITYTDGTESKVPATKLVIDANEFSGNTSLATVSFPLCTDINYLAFDGCTSLTSANFPVCTSIGENTFQSCSSLITVSLPSCSYIGFGAFDYCSKLTTLYIGTSISTVCDLAYPDLFWGSPVLTSIYVPASLVDAYKVAPNWSVYANKIVPYNG